MRHRLRCRQIVVVNMSMTEQLRQFPVRQIRSDKGRVGASVVMDVAPENGSTTSRHSERSNIVDASKRLQRIGVIRGRGLSPPP
jgi:hypothetical protein